MRAAQALAKRQAAAFHQFLVVPQDLGQAVEGDAAVEVVDVVDADVGGQPAQHRGQVVVRAAIERGLVQLPVLRLVPMRRLELVLDIEQPHADRGGDERGGQEHEEKRVEADKPDDGTKDDEQHQVGAHGAEPVAGLVHQAQGQAVLQDEQVARAKAEEHQGVPVGSVQEAAEGRAGAVFADREGGDVADAAMVEVAGMAVVDGVGAPPDRVGCQREDAKRPANPVGQGAIGEERSVAAIVLDAEQAEEEAAVHDGDGEGAKVAVRGDPAGERPERDEGDEADAKLEARADRVRVAVAGEDLDPIAGRHVGRAGGVLGHVASFACPE